MTYKFSILLAGLCSAGCASPSPSEPPAVTSAHTLSEAEAADVRGATAKRLKDPDAAKFGRLAAAKATDGTIAVCGYVNGKNGFGGYTGERLFFGTFSNGKFFPYAIADTGIEEKVARSRCEHYGITGI